MSVKSNKGVLEINFTGKQIVSMCDASEHAAGYVHLIKNYTNDETVQTNRFPPVPLFRKGPPRGKCC